MILTIFTCSMIYFILHGTVRVYLDRKKFTHIPLKEYIKLAVLIMGGLSVVMSLFLTTVAYVLIELNK